MFPRLTIRVAFPKQHGAKRVWLSASRGLPLCLSSGAIDKELSNAMDALTFALSGSSSSDTKTVLTATAKAQLKQSSLKKPKVKRAVLAAKRRKQKSKRMHEAVNDRIAAKLEKAQRKQTIKKLALK
eukprot:TRINITY_DN6225_c0_g1_i3.p2 TRINITY_DN6225_c0_g1~~TRINITY_DN6225_c0_g1_i3.p2  ORF type:complete len:127 (+),score=25.15 TRINITY_DN6225_c0_g1_i3:92-472(+)